MENCSSAHFYSRLQNRKYQFPWKGQLELTYRCNVECIHCYCKGSENKDEELSTSEWKKIINEIHREGCLLLNFTGGEPLVRDDFLELHAYAKSKGFLTMLFTNGLLITKKMIDYLVKSPPYSIEITLYGITKKTYEAITQVKGSFAKAIRVVRMLAEEKLPLIVKTMCLQQNKHEIGRIKAFTEELLGRVSENKYHFRYGQMIYPRLNGDTTPCNYRLSFEEIIEVIKQDVDMRQEYIDGLEVATHYLQRDKHFLYQCNAWMEQFIINPYGRLKFCSFTDKFSSDLKKISFHKGYYKVFPKLLNEKFNTDSPCRNCNLRPICYYCPARAYLETGDEEAPVPHYCELAKAMAEQKKLSI